MPKAIFKIDDPFETDLPEETVEWPNDDVWFQIGHKADFDADEWLEQLSKNLEY